MEKADLALGTRLARHRQNPAVRRPAQAGELGDQGPLLFGAAALLVIGLANPEPRLVRAGGAMLLATVTASALKRLVKRNLTRTRPKTLLEDGRYSLQQGGSKTRAGQSFPSGHVSGSVAAALALSRTFPKVRPWALGASASVALTRLVKGEHWPLDVLAGALLGGTAEALTRCVGSYLGGSPKSGGRRR